MRITLKPKGSGTDALQFFPSAYNECKEFHCMDYPSAVGHFSDQVQSLERIEIIEPNAGGMLVVIEDDLHVGECVTAWFTYVLPEYRNSGLYRKLFRELISTCHKTGIHNYAYSHRVGLGKYLITYGRV